MWPIGAITNLVHGHFIDFYEFSLTTASFLHSTLSTTHGPLRPITLSAQSSALLHRAFIYFERESVILQSFASQFKQNTSHSIVTHNYFFHRFSFACLFGNKLLKDI